MITSVVIKTLEYLRNESIKKRRISITDGSL